VREGWSRVPGWLAEAADRVVASDPGLARLRMALSATAGMASALAVEFAYATITHAGATGSLIAMLLGAVVAMMGSMALTGTGAWRKARTAVFFPVALGLGMVAGVAVAGRTDLMLGIFVAVMFVAVFVRRFGVQFFFYGFMGWMGYFFASFLHATLSMLPSLLADVTLASAWVLLLSITVLRTNPTRTLRRTIRAFSARARAVTRACADLLEAADAQPGQQERARRRLRASQAKLAEAALIVEGWSAEPGATGAGLSASALRRALVDAQQILDRLAAASDALVVDSVDSTDGSDLATAAAGIADRLTRRDYPAANRAARAMAEAADTASAQDSLAGWWPARHFAVAALEFVVLAEQTNDDTSAPDTDDDFEAVVGLAMGNLPGSPAVAADVAARGTRWNPLARLGMVNRQAIQVAVAGALSILAGRELSETRYYWAVIAAFIIFTGTATRTETAIKGVNRVFGTLAGLFASIWVAELTAGRTSWVLFAIVASMFCGFYLIRVSYAYMIFFLTIMLGQLYSVLHEFSPGLLVLRLEETAIGAAVGFIVAVVVTPLSTRDTVRAARNNLLNGLAELLGAVADRISEPTLPAPDIDALSRALDNHLRQLAIVARPLTRPLLWGNSPPRTRRRLALYAALTTHARALAVAARQPAPHSDGPAAACRALAIAATLLTEAPTGQAQPAAADPLATADAALFAHTDAVPGTRATDPVLHALIHVADVLCELTGTPAQPCRSAHHGPGYRPDPVGPALPVLESAGQSTTSRS
jgi:uncharacterized membrane protein YccC